MHTIHHFLTGCLALICAGFLAVAYTPALAIPTALIVPTSLATFVPADATAAYGHVQFCQIQQIAGHAVTPDCQAD